MLTPSSQRSRKNINLIGLGILANAGCVPGYQSTPIPPCFFADDPDPACQSGQGHDGSGTSGGVPTTGTTFPGDDSNTQGAEGQGTGTDSSEVDPATTTSGSGSESTGPAVVPEPEILDLDLDPDAPKSAGPLMVTVQAANAVEVWMTVDEGGEVALEPVGDEGTEFVGEIAVLGESWNGEHTVSAVARAGELESLPREAMFTVTAPPAGTAAWKKKSTLTPSYGNAVAVDVHGEVYELLTFTGNGTARCHVRRRSAVGVPVWPQDTVQLTEGIFCVGEDIKVAPDGTLWVLVNTLAANILRWQLFHLDADGALLDGMPEVSDVNETGRGLDVNADGEVLLCGERPAVQGIDAWVWLRTGGGDGWNVPWVYDPEGYEFDERAKDCAFVEDHIVLVGEVFGQHGQVINSVSRGFAVEYAQNGVEMPRTIASDDTAQQSGFQAVAPDGSGGYVAVGYTCDMAMVPCTPTSGVLTRFVLGASMDWERPHNISATVWDIASSPAGYVVIAARATADNQGVPGARMVGRLGGAFVELSGGAQRSAGGDRDYRGSLRHRIRWRLLPR
jgi:hypothetical protein